MTQQAVLNSASIAASIITTSVRGTPWCILLKRAREGGSLDCYSATVFPDCFLCRAVSSQALITEVKEAEPEGLGAIDDGMGGMTQM